MARRKRNKSASKWCRKCRLLFSPDTNLWRGMCPSCLDAERKRRRAETGAKKIAQATERVEVRDGREFTVKELPPVRRYRVR